MTDTDDLDHEEIFKALSSAARRDMLASLKDPASHFAAQAHPLEMGVCASQFERSGLSQSTVSAHLSALSRAGLVTSSRVGQWVFYKRNEDTIARFLAWLTVAL